MRTGTSVMLAVLAALPVGALMAQHPRASAAIVRTAIPVVLEIPPGATAFNMVQQVLQTARVPHGIEQAPYTAEAAPVDFGRRPDRIVTLNGMSVGDALNAIVREDPRYEWSEVNGRILVRAATARGIGALDARIERFVVRDVSFTDAFTALVDAIDPGRPRPSLIRHGLTLDVSGQRAAPLGVARETSRQAPASAPPRSSDERLMTLALHGATLLEILDAIAQAHGELSWSVRYDRDGVRLENATISLMGHGLAATASSAHRERETARIRDRDRMTIPIVRSLDSMLSRYAQRARVQAGIELMTDHNLLAFPDVPPLDLTDLPSDTAVSRIVALDSRFEWVDAGGIFNVHPKPEHARRPSILDHPIETFSVADVTAEGALDAIVDLFDDASPGEGYGEGGLIDVDEKEQRRRIAEGRARKISLTLTHSTLRALLNAVCRAHGTLSWSLRPQGERGRQRTYTITLESYDGWSVSKTFRVA